MAGLVLVWVVVSSRAEQLGITAPLLFMVAGAALGGERVLHITLSSSTIRVAAELTLVMVLFADAARVRLPSLRHDIGLPARLLGIGLPLTIGLGALAAHLLYGSLGVWTAVLVAACLAPTDAGLGAGIVTDRSVPSRVRLSLNVESGLNDGIVAPLVSLAIAVLAGHVADVSGSVVHATREVGVGALVGIGGGWAVGWLLLLAVRRGWNEVGTVRVATAGAALGTYALAVAVHGNGFVAAFLAGVCFGTFQHQIGPRTLELTEGIGQLLACLVWFAFGAAMVRPAISAPDLGRALGYALLSLTVVRMLAVAVAMVRTRLGVPTVAFIGWFGPRGLASVIFALLALDALGPGAATLVAVVSVTVALSVVAHGLSAHPLIARYAAHARSREPGHPLGDDVAVPAVRRAFGTAAGQRPRNA